MIIDKIFDNTKDGVPNYSIDLIDGTRLYYRGTVLNPMPQSGDAINYTIINTKTSANGNPYTNIKDVEIASMPDNGQASYQSQQTPHNIPLHRQHNQCHRLIIPIHLNSLLVALIKAIHSV